MFIRGGARLAAVLLMLLLCFGGAAALAKVAGHGKRRSRPAHGPAGPRGLVGAAGPIGPGGPGGPNGVQGPQGVAGARAGALRERVEINWQNGQSDGRDTAAFLIPGVGPGVLACRPDTTWINFTRSDPANLASVTATYLRDSGTAVRTINETQYTGDQFNFGFNLQNPRPESTARGSLVGIIGSRGRLGQLNGPGPAPTTFRVSWYWADFNTPTARCYVNASFTSNA